MLSRRLAWHRRSLLSLFSRTTMLYSCVFAALIASTSALLVAPLQSQCSPAAAATQMSLSRRAVIATLPLAALPLAAHAGAESLAADESSLEAEESMIKKTDAKLNKERNLAFQDEIALEKAQDDYVEALKKNDQKAVDALKVKIKALKADYASNENQVLALRAEEAKEIEVEASLKSKVKADEVAELELEDKEMLQAEVAELKKNVDSEAGFNVLKILGF